MIANDLLPRLIGMIEKDAYQLISNAGFFPRITKRDNKAYICTRDYRTDRINLEIENDIVVKADVG